MSEAGNNVPNSTKSGATGTNNNPSSRNNRSRRDRYRYNSNRGTSTSAFKGNVAEMNGNVFQLATERKTKDQFNDTLEALNIYPSAKFSEDIAHLDPLFQKLKKPTIKKTIKPEPTKVKTMMEPPHLCQWIPLTQTFIRKESKSMIRKLKGPKEPSEHYTMWSGGKQATFYETNFKNSPISKKSRTTQT